MALAVANRYAQALVDVVTAPDSGVAPEQAESQIRLFEDLFAESAELRTILLNPAVPPPRKRAVIARLADATGASEIIRNFLYVIIDHRRLNVFKEIRVAIQDLLDERIGLVRADVSSAAALSEAQRERIRQELSRITGKQVRCEYTVEDELIGGAVVQVGSSVFDGSIRGRLEALRDHLVE